MDRSLVASLPLPPIRFARTKLPLEFKVTRKKSPSPTLVGEATGPGSKSAVGKPASTMDVPMIIDDDASASIS
jgi:hypothetical protein